LIAGRSGSTGVTVVLARPNDRAILTNPGTIGDLRTKRSTVLLDSARHVHVSSYFHAAPPRAGLLALFERSWPGRHHPRPELGSVERWAVA
jgi:sugar/nucleoside kinase (ribokinase family)